MSLLFASILNSSVMLGNYLQQTTFSDAFFLGAFRVKIKVFKTFFRNTIRVSNDLDPDQDQLLLTNLSAVNRQES